MQEDEEGSVVIIDDTQNPLAGPGTNMTNSDKNKLENKIVALTNDSRSNGGKSRLKKSVRLAKSSTLRAKELPKRWSHTRPSGKRWVTALSAKGISVSKAYTAENLASMCVYAKSDYTDEDLERYAKTIHRNLMNSSGHRHNIMNKHYKYVGVSVYTKFKNNRLVIYVCEHFSSRRN